MTGVDMEGLYLLASILRAGAIVARAAFLHMLRVSEQSKFVDLRTAMTVAGLRAFVTARPTKSVTKVQKQLSADPGVKGRIWVSTYSSPPSPGTGVKDAMVRAIEGLRQPGTPSREDLVVPEAVAVEAEWTGYRAGAARKDPPPSISESEKYAGMMKECKSPVTVLYFHGGAYWLLDPASHRPTTKKLAKQMGGRCYSVRYRLAPQNPFPAAVMDGLSAYLTLLYPPPGAFHEAVRPEHIVFAGDSAGGNLCLALTQTLLELRRQDARVSWFGADRELPLPAAVALNSPWADVTHSMPSCKANAPFDYLPSPTRQARHAPSWPACPAWPASPVRATMYVADALLNHPLVTVLLAPSWEGCPPVYICTGRELLADEDKFMASRLHSAGVPVVFEEYEAMPHCFALVMPKMKGARRCMDGWAGFTERVVGEGAEGVESTFTRVEAKTLKEVKLDPTALSPFTAEQVAERVRKQIEVMVAPQVTEKAKL